MEKLHSIQPIIDSTIINILIVDDDDVDRERIRRMLSKSDVNAHITEASSLEDSMECLDKSEFDCVIVDYRLGVSSGLTLLNNIRTSINNHCAVIMITGLGDEEIAAEAMRLGASDYLLKKQLKSTQLLHSIVSSIQRASLEKKLHEMAHYDSLTGLASRPLLLETLQDAIDSNTATTVAFIDLDNFKPINDNYGHDTGDFVLATIAKRLKSIVRKGDTLARIGGDEFVLLLNGVMKTSECNAALNNILKTINDPIELAEFDRSVEVSASIGVALTLANNDELDAEDILRRADQTMYHAKHLGNNNFLFYDPEEETLRHAKHALLQAAEQAISRNEFVLHYQPKVDMTDHHLVGVEALIRWNHPTLGLLYPADFAEALEHPTIGIKIGEWVLTEALKQHDIWHKTNLTMSVNIAPAHLLSKGFVDKLSQLLQSTHALDSRQLELEILESSTLRDIDKAVEILKGCRELGVTIALDDFGTGYASLSYLKKLPLDTLKIDQSFIKKLLSDSEDRSIVTCIVALSQAFGYNLIAEGVESLEHEQVLMDMGCHLGQGYFIAKPMCSDSMAMWINTMTKEPVHYMN